MMPGDSMTDLRYPVGNHDATAPVTPEQVASAIEDIRALPERLEAAVDGLTDEQLDTPYRPSGWTVRQVVHHLPDSHLNAHVRLRLALTEDAPVIRPYQEALWAELPDARLPPAPSLTLLRGLHERWVALLEALTPEQLERPWIHPDVPSDGRLTLAQLVVRYGWHSRHHVALVTALRERGGW
jgi:hypothetical protein